LFVDKPSVMRRFRAQDHATARGCYSKSEGSAWSIPLFAALTSFASGSPERGFGLYDKAQCQPIEIKEFVDD